MKVHKRKSRRGFNDKFLKVLIPLLGLGVYFVYENMDSKQPELTSSEQELVDIEFDSDKYPDNIVVLKGTANVTEKEKELIESRKESVKFEYKATNESDKLTEIEVDKSWQDYSGLDKLGRTQEAVAYVTFDGVYHHSRKSIKRPEFSSSTHVSGEFLDGVYDREKETWRSKNEKEFRNNKIVEQGDYKGYIYNKSHSIAWSLGGDMETHNLTLGTRGQNVGKNDGNGGMAYAETMIRDNINQDHNKSYFYSVKPIYKGNELVPRGSLQRVYSVHDNGKSMDYSVWVFNAQKGLDINYNTGEWEITGK